MATGAAPDFLLRSRDNAAGWQTVRGLIAALERHEIKSLVNPIEAGHGRVRLGDRMKEAQGGVNHPGPLPSPAQPRHAQPGPVSVHLTQKGLRPGAERFAK